MEILSTPGECFTGMPDFGVPVRFDEVHGLAIASVDVGSGPTVLLMHGEPSWSFLYRHVIRDLVEAGHRVLAPDLVGFGRSDKPAEVSDHTYQRHVDWMQAWLRAVDPDGVSLFCQDWGGLIGLRLLAAEPDRFARFAVANTGLPTGDQAPSEAFLGWRRFAVEIPQFPVGAIVAGGTVGGLSQEVIAAYDAPFPDESFKAGPRAMPALVPITPDDPAAEPNRAAWEVLKRWTKPCLTLFSDGDPITAGGERIFQRLVPGAAGQPHRTIPDAGHFLQEDAPGAIAGELIDWIRSSG